MVFRWFDDPNTYEICSTITGGPRPWAEIDSLDLEEELETGYLGRATKTRCGEVLRTEFDTGRLGGSGGHSFYLSEVLDYVGHLARVGLDTSPGLVARGAGTLLGWIDAVVNSPTGGPEVAQIVTVRASGEEAHIVHLEMTDRATSVVGHEMVFAAIHQAAQNGIHRLYSPRSIAYIAPFGFTEAPDQPGMVVYDITAQDLNWPEELSADVVT
jgi:hypothetical protein